MSGVLSEEAREYLVNMLEDHKADVEAEGFNGCSESDFINWNSMKADRIAKADKVLREVLDVRVH